ncbi:hypothetical protein HYV85_04705 [Candidatus Woesearchaeota archaeon]|nr:hypothetical protein [Candidatus Woesearchaeota archaeon]
MNQVSVVKQSFAEFPGLERHVVEFGSAKIFIDTYPDLYSAYWWCKLNPLTITAEVRRLYTEMMPQSLRGKTFPTWLYTQSGGVKGEQLGPMELSEALSRLPTPAPDFFRSYTPTFDVVVNRNSQSVPEGPAILSKIAVPGLILQFYEATSGNVLGEIKGQLEQKLTELLRTYQALPQK